MNALRVTIFLIITCFSCQSQVWLDRRVNAYDCNHAMVGTTKGAYTNAELVYSVSLPRQELYTNWFTSSIEYPNIPPSNEIFVTTEYHATGYHETGIVVSNTVVVLNWKGKETKVVLESSTVRYEARVTWK